mmetsp:Transcript_3304/g.20582  ORF Transcript_3304/g.20582 Transcript_3304/m.20582 type:complete len:289 (-) Transcript_3304:1853-2719(-)
MEQQDQAEDHPSPGERKAYERKVLNSPEELQQRKRISSKLYALHYDVPYVFDTPEFFERVVDDLIQTTRRNREMRESFEKELNIQIEKAVISERNFMDMEGENVKLKRRLAEQEEEIRRGMEEWGVEIRSLDEQRERLQAMLVAVEESHNKETQKNIHLEQELQAAARRIEVLDQMTKNATVEETQHASLKIELETTKDRLDRLLSEMAQKDSECKQLRQLLQEEQQQTQQARFTQHAHDSVVKSLNAQIDFMADRIAAFEEDELRANEVELQLKKTPKASKEVDCRA